MNDKQLDDMLRDWSNDRLPNEEKRDHILRDVFAPYRIVAEKPSSWNSFRKKSWVAVSAGICVVLVILLLFRPAPQVRLPAPADDSLIVSVAEDDPQIGEQPIRVSLLVLRRVPDSESDVEFLEDAVLIAEKDRWNELELNGHRMFLWVYPLEKTLFSLDVGIDKAAKTGIVAGPDRTQALHFKSNGDLFDVFVSVLPNS